jgi:hypothetical protein
MFRSARNDLGAADDNEDIVVDPAMLPEALTKARRLVAEMEKQQAEVEAAPPNLPPEQLAMGKLAFDNALTAARRMLKALEEAKKIEYDSVKPPNDPN